MKFLALSALILLSGNTTFAECRVAMTSSGFEVCGELKDNNDGTMTIMSPRFDSTVGLKPKKEMAKKVCEAFGTEFIDYTKTVGHDIGRAEWLTANTYARGPKEKRVKIIDQVTCGIYKEFGGRGENDLVTIQSEAPYQYDVETKIENGVLTTAPKMANFYIVGGAGPRNQSIGYYGASAYYSAREFCQLNGFKNYSSFGGKWVYGDQPKSATVVAFDINGKAEFLNPAYSLVIFNYIRCKAY